MNTLEDAVIENEGLVYSIINKFDYLNDRDDLYQVGMMGLINAFKNYDKSKNTKFSSYAYFYILGEVKKYIREKSGIKIDRKMEHLSLMIEKATIVLTQRLMRYPTDSDLALFLEIPLEDVKNVKEAKILIDSLDEEKDDLSLYDSLGYDESMYNPDVLDLKEEIDNLPEFERRLITERFYYDKTQKEVSDSLGVNQVKVSRTERVVLQKLKERL
jgi:RNA polymerase sporulation-specific sigma factor